MNGTIFYIFQAVVLIFSMIVHEISHGVMAYKLGDDTAKRMGRLTLNPLKHLDFFGSILLPLFLILAGSKFIFGWAKPVLFNPFNLKNPKRDIAMIGAAGPASTLVTAIIFGLIIRLAAPFLDLQSSPVMTTFFIFLNMIVFINVLMTVFNLIPVPPWDGSKILFAFLPDKYQSTQISLERYGMPIILIFLFFGGFNLVSSITYWIYSFIVGPWAMF